MLKNKVIKNLQTTGFSMLNEIPFSKSTREKALAYTNTKVNQSNKNQNSIIINDNDIYLPEQASYSSVRNLSKLFGQKLPEKTVIYRRHDNEERGLFVDLINPDLAIKELRDELYESSIFKLLEKTSGILSSDVEFHIYYTKSCIKPRSWHIDGPSLKIFTYLTDVTKDHGPYAYQLKSQRHYDRAFTLKIAPNLNQLKAKVSQKHFNADHVISLEGVEGTSFISNQAGIHRGLDQNKNLERIVLVTQFL